jgi:putative AdoMet-dependent methyltransferase
MSVENLESQFDRWAPSYDADVRDGAGFPFDGYERVLNRTVELAGIQPGMDVLELGPGTGNLTARLVAAAAVWAVDFSAEMLARAREKVPAARFAQAGLMDDYPPDFRRPFARVVSTYTFHELPLADKLTLLRRLAAGYLQPGGRIVIGDIGFPDAAALDAMRRAAGDSWDEEHYWVMDEVTKSLAEAGFTINHEQLSSCGVVLSIKAALLAPALSASSSRF